MPINAPLAQDIWLRYVYVRDNGHFDYIIKANLCDDFYLNNQWSPIDKAQLDQQRRPALTINKILSTLSNVQGDQIQSRADTTFKPTHAEGEDSSHILEGLFKQSAAVNKLDWKESEVFADGAITSRGFYDLRLGFKNNIRGEIEITVPNPRNVLIDPDGEEYDPDTWKDVFTTKWLAPNDVAILFNEEDAEYLTYNYTNPYIADIDSVQHSFERFGGLGHYPTFNPIARDIIRNIRVLERQYKKRTNVKHFVDTRTGDLRPIPESWTRNQIAQVSDQYQLGVISKLTERIRWTTTAGNVVLHDDWSPYKHFTPVPYFPYFRRGRTMGLVENLIDSQVLLNKVSSQELHIVNTTANSGYMVKEGSLRNMTLEELETRGAETGVVIALSDIKDLEKIQPNQIPTGIDRISYKAEEHIKAISNIDDNALGQDRADVAAKAIKAKRERGSVNQLKVMDNLNYTKYLLARNWLDIVQEYYTEPRIYRITFENPVTQEAERNPEGNFININQFNEATGEILNDLSLGSYDVVITTQPSQDTIEESEFAQCVALKQLGVQIPDDVIISHSLLREKRAIVQRMKDAQNSPQAQQAAQNQQAMQQAQLEQAQSEPDRIKAEALLKSAQAQKLVAETVTAAPEQPGESGSDLMSQVMQNHADASKQAADHQLEREKMGHESAMQARDHQHETHQTATEQQHEVGTAQLEHAQSLEQGNQQATNVSKQEKAKAETAIKIAKMKPKPKPAAKGKK